MTSEMTWEEAILTVLQDAGQPLHYQRITEIIGERRLRNVAVSTPANTVNSILNRIVNDEEDSRIHRVGRGIFEVMDSSDSLLELSLEDDVDLTEGNEDSEVRVHAFGLYWDKDKVHWGRGGALQGRQSDAADIVDFSNQQGVYLLYKERSIIYVGRSERGLYGRLRSHVRDAKGPRWDRFSWFGFRAVDEDGNLDEMPNETSMGNLITMLEATLIETLEPPVNGQRGELMGVLYEQVTDPIIASQQARSFLKDLAGV